MAHSDTKVPNSRRLVTIILVIVGLSILLAIAGGVLALVAARRTANKVKEQASQSATLIKELGQYPDSYIQAGLPQYSGAEVTHLGSKDAKPSQGSIVIIVNTQDSVATVAAFYDKELKANGWSLKPEGSTEASELVSRTYTKGNQQYSLLVQTSTDSSNTTAATITWEEAP